MNKSCLKTRLNDLSMIELVKSLLDVCVHLEVSDESVQILHYKPLYDKQYWDHSVAQKILSEMHALKIN